MPTWIAENWILVLPLLIVVGLFVFGFGAMKKRDKYEVFRRVETAAPSIEKPRPRWHGLVAKELDRLPFGKIVFNPPESMRVGVTERVEVRITRDSSTDLITNLKGRGVPQIERIQVNEFMTVRITGTDFSIRPLNTQDQIIGGEDYTEWAWDITPLKSGTKALHLHVTLRIRLPDGEEKKDHPVLDRQINVRVNPIYSTKTFVEKHWKWIVTAIMFPVIGFILQTYL